jgi:PAS domain S-box-containing protein
MADLTAMFLLPFFMPMEKAMWIMRYLHLNIHWAVSLIIVIVLGNGLVYSIRSLYPRILEYQNDLEIEKKRLEKEVEEHEQTEEKITSLGHIFERSLNEIYIFDAQTLKFILVNEGASKNLGYSMEEMRNLTPLDIKPEYTDEDFAALIEPLRTGEVDGVKFTTVHKRKDGSLYPIEVYLQLSTFGPVPAFVAIILDITMRKRAEAKLRRLSQRYEAILKAVPDVIMEVDANKVYRWANQAGHEFFGEGVIGRAASHYFKGDQETYSIVQPLFNGEEDIIYLESWQRRKDNETRLLAWWCRVLKDENGHVVGALSTARDITEHKRAEEALKENEKYLNIAQEIAHIGHWKLNPETNEVTGSDEFFRIFGLTRKEATLEKFIEMVHPEDREFDIDTIGRGIKYGENWNIEHRLLTKDGTEKFVQAIGNAITDETGKTVLVVGTVHDITERKRADEALRAQDHRFRAVLENSPTVIFIKDMESRYLFINRHWEKAFQVRQKDIVGKVDNEIFPKEMAEAFRANDLKVIKAGVPLEFEEIVPHDDGLHTYISIKFPLYDASGKIEAICGIATDITERKHLEQESFKAQKLESVGLLAGGIAHDFNNIITGILGNISLAKIYSSPEGKAFKRLIEAENAVKHATRLAQQLLTFSKGGKPIKKTAYARNLIKDAVSFSLSGSNIRCEYSIREELWPVDMDTGQINQVFSNLVINARHAMPEGGVLKVGAENITIGDDKRDALEGLLKEGRYIKISVTDNGTGIDKVHLDKIFDPYFSTKEGGSGLGLATSYSIINKHDGHITVESQPGAGTTFRLYLPASKELPEDKGREELIASLKEKKHKGMKVLVMDDEEIVRDVAGKILTSLDYEVDFATEGNEAIGLYRKAKESGEPFDVVIMDLTIPGGMGGKEAIKKLLEVDPGAKVIVSSGYFNDPVMSDYKKYGFSGVIAKPYNLAELRATVHKVIAGED